jgi:hypothetical protein
MTRFLFDHRDGEKVSVDDEGLELASADNARQQAKKALGEIARDALPENGDRELGINVRAEDGAPVVDLRLSFKVREPDADQS